VIAAIGVDPDLHNTAIAVVTKERVLALGVIRGQDGLKEDEAVEDMVAEVHNYLPTWLSHMLAQGIKVFSPKPPSRVEGQKFYGKSLPEDLIRLATVSGACLAALNRSWLGQARLVQPTHWKGSVDKTTNQARTLKDYGVGFKVVGGLKGYCVPTTNKEKLPTIWTSDGSPPLQSDWKHVLDAVGIARWTVLGARSK